MDQDIVATISGMVAMVRPWCIGFSIAFQAHDTMCTMHTINLMLARETC